MDFDQILKNLLEKGIDCFNSGDYEALNDLFSKHIQYTAPQYKNSLINEPAVCFNNKNELFSYWKRMHTNYPFVIDDFEFLEIGKVSKLRNVMSDFGFVIDAEIHFDEYGKTTKMFNEISRIIK